VPGGDVRRAGERDVGGLLRPLRAGVLLRRGLDDTDAVPVRVSGAVLPAGVRAPAACSAWVVQRWWPDRRQRRDLPACLSAGLPQRHRPQRHCRPGERRRPPADPVLARAGRCARARLAEGLPRRTPWRRGHAGRAGAVRARVLLRRGKAVRVPSWSRWDALRRGQARVQRALPRRLLLRMGLNDARQEPLRWRRPLLPRGQRGPHPCRRRPAHRPGRACGQAVTPAPLPAGVVLRGGRAAAVPGGDVRRAGERDVGGLLRPLRAGVLLRRGLDDTDAVPVRVSGAVLPAGVRSATGGATGVVQHRKRPGSRPERRQSTGRPVQLHAVCRAPLPRWPLLHGGSDQAVPGRHHRQRDRACLRRLRASVPGGLLLSARLACAA